MGKIRLKLRRMTQGGKRVAPIFSIEKWPYCENLRFLINLTIFLVQNFDIVVIRLVSNVLEQGQ